MGAHVAVVLRRRYIAKILRRPWMLMAPHEALSTVLLLTRWSLMLK